MKVNNTTNGLILQIAKGFRRCFVYRNAVLLIFDDADCESTSKTSRSKFGSIESTHSHFKIFHEVRRKQGIINLLACVAIPFNPFRTSDCWQTIAVISWFNPSCPLSLSLFGCSCKKNQCQWSLPVIIDVFRGTGDEPVLQSVMHMGDLSSVPRSVMLLSYYDLYKQGRKLMNHTTSTS